MIYHAWNHARDARVLFHDSQEYEAFEGWMIRARHNAEDRDLLAPMPVRLPAAWGRRVNEPLAPEELSAIRVCLRRGRPFGGRKTWDRAHTTPQRSAQEERQDDVTAAATRAYNTGVANFCLRIQ